MRPKRRRPRMGFVFFESKARTEGEEDRECSIFGRAWVLVERGNANLWPARSRILDHLAGSEQDSHPNLDVRAGKPRENSPPSRLDHDVVMPRLVGRDIDGESSTFFDNNPRTGLCFVIDIIPGTANQGVFALAAIK